MKFSSQTLLLLASLAAVLCQCAIVDAKKPVSSRSASSSRRAGSGRPAGRPSSSRRKYVEEEEEEEEEDYADFGFPDEYDDDDDDDEYDDEADFRPPSRRSGPPKRGPPPPRSSKKPSRSSGTKKSRSSRSRHYDDDYGRQPRRVSNPSRRSRGRPGGNVVPYSRKTPSTFSRGWEAVRNSIPDPATVREAAVTSLNVARETTSSLSSNIYREVKGLTSSELEQVMLKATRPDDTAVKGKHVERLVGVTYQISSRYDIYDAVLRKLWSKMSEKDWRTTIKALYILHRFSADGAPEHAPALKARLRELRRTVDPKRKDKYFNSKQLLAGDNKPETAGYRAFMSRYAHYVLLRAQCFGGTFDEISSVPKPPKDKKKKSPAPQKPITSTSLRTEHLDASAMLLKAGIACQLKDGEECENTAIAAERVVSDLIALAGAVAMALNRALKNDDAKGVDPGLIKRWCEFYGEDLVPKTRSMMKKTAPKLDAFGLFLPSRMGATVSQDLLQKGLKMGDSEGTATEPGDSEASGEENDDGGETTGSAATEAKEESDTALGNADADDADEDEAGEEEEYDEYEYEEEEYYDDEEPF